MTAEKSVSLYQLTIDFLSIQTLYWFTISHTCFPLCYKVTTHIQYAKMAHIDDIDDIDTDIDTDIDICFPKKERNSLNHSVLVATNVLEPNTPSALHFSGHSYHCDLHITTSANQKMKQWCKRISSEIASSILLSWNTLDHSCPRTFSISVYCSVKEVVMHFRAEHGSQILKQKQISKIWSLQYLINIRQHSRDQCKSLWRAAGEKTVPPQCRVRLDLTQHPLLAAGISITPTFKSLDRLCATLGWGYESLTLSPSKQAGWQKAPADAVRLTGKPFYFNSLFLHK